MPTLLAIHSIRRKHPTAAPNPREIVSRITNDITASRTELATQDVPPGRVFSEASATAANELIAMGAARVATSAEIASATAAGSIL